MGLGEKEKFFIDEELKNSLKKISDLLNNLKIEVKENMDIQLKIIEKTSKYGLLIPFGFDNVDCMEWNGCTDKKKLEDKFTEFFTKNKQKQLVKLKKKFNSEKVLEKFKKFYNQAYYNYNNGKYYCSCIVLTAIFEGLIRNYAKVLYDEKLEKITEINGKLNTKYTNKYSIIFQDKKGIIKFINDFFSRVNQEDINSNNYFNRNVLMHGLDFGKFNKVDALKLFNAIDILNNLMIDDYEVM